MNTESLTLDDYAAAFREAESSEVASKFLQGQIIKRAIEAGNEVDLTCNYIAGIVKKEVGTIYKRYRVARTFQMYDATIGYEIYAVAASCVDYRKSDEDEIARQQAKAQEWIDQVVMYEWSIADLKKAMKGEPVKHSVSFNAVVGEIHEQTDGAVVTLCLDEVPPVKTGDSVKLKIKVEVKAQGDVT